MVKLTLVYGGILNPPRRIWARQSLICGEAHLGGVTSSSAALRARAASKQIFFAVRRFRHLFGDNAPGVLLGRIRCAPAQCGCLSGGRARETKAKRYNRALCALRMRRSKTTASCGRQKHGYLWLNCGRIAMPSSQSASSFAIIIVKAPQGGYRQVDKGLSVKKHAHAKAPGDSWRGARARLDQRQAADKRAKPCSTSCGSRTQTKAPSDDAIFQNNHDDVPHRSFHFHSWSPRPDYSRFTQSGALKRASAGDAACDTARK